MNDVLTGIIVDVKEYREYDVIMQVLGEHQEGIVSIVARGIRKVKSKNAAACQLFTYASFQLNYQEQRTLQTLKTAEIINSYRHIRDDLMKQSIASYFCECIAKSGFEDDVFALLQKSLDCLQTGNSSMRILCAFQVMMNQLHGIEPYVDGCVSCGRSDQICAISIRKGGFVCKECFQSLQDELLSVQDLKYFRLLSKAGMEHYDVLEIIDDISFTHFKLLYSFFEEYAGIHVKSVKFLNCLQDLEE